MRNALRGFLSCILPCGALDVIRIVHTNGRVEEISGDVTAAEIMKLHPRYVLKKPSSSFDSADNPSTVSKIAVVPPEAQLKRGKIYFLIPVLSPPEKPRSTKKMRPEKTRSGDAKNYVASAQYLSSMHSAKLSTAAHGDRRRGRVCNWRPRLESISETSSES